MSKPSALLSNSIGWTLDNYLARNVSQHLSVIRFILFAKLLHFYRNFLHFSPHQETQVPSVATKMRSWDLWKLLFPSYFIFSPFIFYNRSVPSWDDDGLCRYFEQVALTRFVSQANKEEAAMKEQESTISIWLSSLKNPRAKQLRGLETVTSKHFSWKSWEC